MAAGHDIHADYDEHAVTVVSLQRGLVQMGALRTAAPVSKAVVIRLEPAQRAGEKVQWGG